MKALFIIFIAFTCISGCIGPAPHKEMVTPQISGTVVDAETGVPIDGVSVSLIPGESFGVVFTTNIVHRDVSETVFTDSTGKFIIQPTRGWYFWVHPMPRGGGAVHELLLVFDHPDYQKDIYSWRESFASYEKIPPLTLGEKKLTKMKASLN